MSWAPAPDARLLEGRGHQQVGLGHVVVERHVVGDPVLDLRPRQPGRRVGRRRDRQARPGRGCDERRGRRQLDRGPGSARGVDLHGLVLRQRDLLALRRLDLGLALEDLDARLAALADVDVAGRVLERSRAHRGRHDLGGLAGHREVDAAGLHAPGCSRGLGRSTDVDDAVRAHLHDAARVEGDLGTRAGLGLHDVADVQLLGETGLAPALLRVRLDLDLALDARQPRDLLARLRHRLAHEEVPVGDDRGECDAPPDDAQRVLVEGLAHRPAELGRREDVRPFSFGVVDVFVASHSS